jgi:hypothetical protein
MQRDGSFEELGNLGAMESGFIPNPEGTQWIWSTYEGNSQNNNAHSTVYVGGAGRSPHIIGQATELARGLAPYEWTATGAIIQDAPSGIGGYIPVGAAIGPVERYDPKNGSLTPVTSSQTCMFSDLAADGTIACFPRQPLHSVRLIYKDGRTVTIPLATPRFNLTGDAYFRPRADLMTVAGAVGNQSSEHYGLDLVKPSDASISRFGPDDLLPAMRERSWLPDGSLVMRHEDFVPGDPGIYLLSPSGNAVKVASTGVAVGFLG